MYEDIVEVLEGGMWWSNHYLAHGYRLLDIQTGTRASVYPPHASNAGQAYVRRNPIFVLGRPRDVERVEAPLPRRRPPSPDATALEEPTETQEVEPIAAVQGGNHD